MVVLISNSALSGVLFLDVIKDSMFNKEIRIKEMGGENLYVFVIRVEVEAEVL